MYRNLRQCVEDLEAGGQLRRIDIPVDPHLELAEIQRRVFRAGGPALLFTRVVGCRFPVLCNLFGTRERTRYLFRDAWELLKKIAALQVDPADLLRRPRLYLSLKIPGAMLLSRPRKVRWGPVLSCETTIAQLPQIKCWPDDGGPYITLPQVYTEDPDRPGLEHSNLGMYRVQLGGGDYEPDKEIGLHYQLQRGIAAHHAAALRRGEDLPVNIFVGGPPAMTVAAVMPLPEGVSELFFAGILGRRRVPMICRPGRLPIHAEADFCIVGKLAHDCLKPEGPFGDHLGYYSLAHDFPVLRVEKVYHRPDAIWPMTVVGRPPQEDSILTELVHELAEPVLPKQIAGVHAVHAVEAAGVHPLLLAVGSERYVPYEKRRPRELLVQANALLGHGQLSLAKYLWIVAREDDPQLDVRRVDDFFRHVLLRVDWRRDLHFETCSTMDTLDYSSGRLHEGSKVVIAAAGEPRRTLPAAWNERYRLPEGLGFRRPRVVLPGLLVVEAPTYKQSAEGKDAAMEHFCRYYRSSDTINEFPLIVAVDDSDFCARSLDDFLWVTFTRSNPETDIYGIGSFVCGKHWGCEGALVIDARTKPHHALPVVEDPAVSRRVDALAASGGPLHGII